MRALVVRGHPYLVECYSESRSQSALRVYVSEQAGAKVVTELALVSMVKFRPLSLGALTSALHERSARGRFSQPFFNVGVQSALPVGFDAKVHYEVSTRSAGEGCWSCRFLHLVLQASGCQYGFQPICMSGALLNFNNGKLFLISLRLSHKVSNADSELSLIHIS